MMKDVSNGTFCVLPFIEHFVSLDGNRYFCCQGEGHAPIDSRDHAEQLKEDIACGKRVPQCTTCYDIEDAGGISSRTRETSRWLADHDVAAYIDNWEMYTAEANYFYDVRYDNKCNLACIICKPDNSSLWQQELGIPVYSRTLDLTQADILQAKKVYLAGGEPLIINEFLQLLQLISESEVQPEVVINTNLSRVSNDIKVILEKIKNLTLTISVDSYGKVNEYHRYPLNWDKFLRNLDWAKELDCTLMFNSVIDAVSVIDMGNLIELEDGIDFWTLSFVANRNKLQVENIPLQYKEEIIKRFEKLKQSKFYITGSEFQVNVDVTIKQIRKDGTPTLLSSFICELDDRRNINHVNYLGVTYASPPRRNS